MVTAPADRPVNVLVALVTYNSARVVETCLRSLGPALDGVRDVQVVVVDNASTDDTVERVRAVAPHARVVAAGANLGYGAGINVAVETAPPSRAVIVLNPDTAPQPGSLRRLVEALNRPGVGISVPRITDLEGRLKFSLRREPTLLRAVGEAVLGGHRAARYPLLGDMVRDPAAYVDGATADWATGAAMAISRATLDTVGPWEESYFLYSEETDFALRARDAGFRLSYVADAEIRHPGGDMSRSPMLWSILAVNRVTLYRRRHGRVPAAAYWLVVMANELARALLGRPTHRAAVRALVRGRPLPPDAAGVTRA